VLLLLLNVCASFELRGVKNYPEELLVSTTQGNIQGTYNELGIRQWKGIPYAKPPVDSLRWQYPQPLDLSTETYIADFNAERQLYLQTEKFLEFLGSWESSESTLPERMEDLWGAAYERGYVEISDLESLWLWIDALKLVGYAFPDVMDSSDTNSPSPSPYNVSAASEKRHHGNKNRRKKQNSTQRGKGKARTPFPEEFEAPEPQPPT